MSSNSPTTHDKLTTNRMQQPISNHGCECPHYHNTTKALMCNQRQRMPTCPPDFKRHCCDPYKQKGFNCLDFPEADAPINDAALAEQALKNYLQPTSDVARIGSTFAPPEPELERTAECSVCWNVEACSLMIKQASTFEGTSEIRWLCQKCHARSSKDGEKLRWPPAPRQWKKGPQTFKAMATANRRHYIARYEPVRVLASEAYRVESLVKDVEHPTPRDVGGEAAVKIQCFHCAYLFPKRCIAGQVPAHMSTAEESAATDPMYARLHQVERVFECWNCYYLRMSHLEWLNVQHAKQQEAILRLGVHLEASESAPETLLCTETVRPSEFDDDYESSSSSDDTTSTSMDSQPDENEGEQPPRAPSDNDEEVETWLDALILDAPPELRCMALDDLWEQSFSQTVGANFWSCGP